MLALTHLVLALLLIKLFGLERSAAFATLMLGVFIDLDHIFGIVEFWTREGVANAFNVQAAWATDIQWKSLIHSPEGVLLVGPVSLTAGSLVPFAAWGLHLIMDYVQMFYLGVASPIEILLLVAMTVGLLLIERQDYTAQSDDPSLKGLLVWEAGRIGETVLSLPVVRLLKRKKGPRGTSS